MKFRLTTTVSLFALALAGCSSAPMMMSNSDAQSPTYVKTSASTPDAPAPGVHTTTVFVTDSPRNQSEYRSSIAGPGLLGLVSSQLAQRKATDPNVKAFADAEVAEQQGVSQALKNMNTTIPLLNAEQQDLMGELTKAPRGRAFDEAYMRAQVMNHERLKLVTKNYLHYASSYTRDAMEHDGQNMAGATLPVIQRHLTTAKRLSSMLD